MKSATKIALLLGLVLTFAPSLILGSDVLQPRDDSPSSGLLEKRSYDSPKILSRKRNAHACIMSIVFIILFPLGAISVHLPINRIPFLKNTYLTRKIPAIHAPIQTIGLVMLIGGMALGIRIAHDLRLLSNPVHAHVVIGLLVASIIILVQPAMGIAQHLYFKKHGKTSAFGYVHRWVGRGAIILGIINNGLGFQLAEQDIDVPTSSYIRNFVIAGCLAFIWVGLVAYDTLGSKKTVDVERKGETDKSEIVQTTS